MSDIITLEVLGEANFISESFCAEFAQRLTLKIRQILWHVFSIIIVSSAVFV